MGVETGSSPVAQRRRYVPAVGPHLKKLLAIVFGLFALLGVNATYLVSITILEWRSGRTYQDYFYQCMFLLHLILGALIILPVVVFGIAHIRNAHNRPNRRAVRAGYVLFAVSLILLASGVVLTRIEGVIVVRDATLRTIAYWAHVISPIVAVWLFVIHRLAGRRIKWRIGLAWAGVAAVFALAMVGLHAQDPRAWNQVGPESGEQYFFPSLARTATGGFIPAPTLMNDAYCVDCHADVHAGWSSSVHRFSSFNNPPYLFSVLNTRRKMFERDGNVQGARFCAGCHDPVPFFSGAFDEPRFDDPAYDISSDATAQAGITCTVCHAITHINSPRGNADYTIEEPLHYPFAFSDNAVLKWVNHQLVKAKPAFHKKTFLKPLHRTPEFCGSCHKVHLPQELNAYRFLRGQNHYDAFLLSGVSGHGVTSFYYPPVAEANCNNCHMQPIDSNDFAARPLDGTGISQIHDHQFPSANTAIPKLVGMADDVITAHREFNEGVVRVDIFGIREGGTIDGTLHAPLRPVSPTLMRGQRYLLEVVVRTVKMGHLFTQGTADSNEVWLDVTLRSGDRVIGRSGSYQDDEGTVDPWAHFLNAFVIDRHGRRIDRRNAEDIFVALYNHQIPPGAADSVHYAFDVPADVAGPLTVEVALRYRKFDTTYMKLFQGDEFVTNDLPVMTLATDHMTLPIEGLADAPVQEAPAFPTWQRWNDYGIGLLRKGNEGSNRGQLRQAEDAFAEVSRLGRPDGALNRARLYIKEGRLGEAVAMLNAASAHDPPAPPWSVAWFTGLVNRQNGFLDEAVSNFKNVLAMKDTTECRRRGFDFTLDYRLLNELGKTLFDQSKQHRGEQRALQRKQLLDEAMEVFQAALRVDPENVSAHYNLGLIHAALGDDAQARHHREFHSTYKPDDNARDAAIAAARQLYPAANHAAEAIVIYDLQRDVRPVAEPHAKSNTP
jgi:hypothetical protein